MSKMMKMILCSVLFGLAGCTASPSASSTPASQTSQTASASSKKSQESAAAKSQIQTSTALSASSQTRSVPSASSSESLRLRADSLIQELKAAGFPITDYEMEFTEVSFDAGWMGAEIRQVPSPMQAYERAQYDDEVEKQQEFTNGSGSLCILRNWEDGTYEIIAVNETDGLLYEIDDIAESDLSTVKTIMTGLGFQTS